jgi:hypothetical protein
MATPISGIQPMRYLWTAVAAVAVIGAVMLAQTPGRLSGLRAPQAPGTVSARLKG